jgi:hypothetical protein
MYGKTSVVGVTIGSGGLAATGFGVAWYVLTATVLLIGGVLLVRWTHRRAATR